MAVRPQPWNRNIGVTSPLKIFNSLILLAFVILLCGGKEEGESLSEIENKKGQLKNAEESISNLNADVDPLKSLVFGPGLSPHKVVLPLYYFYIQLVDGRGENVTRGAFGNDELKVNIDCEGEEIGMYAGRQKIPIWTQVLNRKDGSFLVRYKVLLSCAKNEKSVLRMQVLWGNKHIGKSPYVIRKAVHPDTCYCPSTSHSQWLKQAECDVEHNRFQIAADLRYFPEKSVDFDAVLNATLTKFHGYSGSHSFCHYVVKDNRIFRKCYGQYVGFHIFPDSILLSLTRKIKLQDMELLFNLGDWPLVNRLAKDAVILPIFSWCKSNMTADILVPTYELTEASLEGMGRVTLDMMTVQANSELSWDSKIEKLFWRGRDSRQERLDLVALSRKHPELINASLTNFFFFRDQQELYGPKEDHVSFFKFFDFKYQLNIDGTVAAYRFPFLLGGDSVVLKTDSKYVEHFYGDLEPWVHYIPVDAQLEDLVEKIKWLKDNDEEAKKIGRSGRKYAQEHLMPKDVLCYYVQVFLEWSKRLKNPVRVREGMELVEQPKIPRTTSCGCQPETKFQEEEGGSEKNFNHSNSPPGEKRKDEL